MRAILAKYDRHVVAATAALAILGGIVRAFSYKPGSYILIATVLLYIVYRTFYYSVALRHKDKLSGADKQHLITFIIILSIAILAYLGLSKPEFILLFVLLVDYVISINQAKPTSHE